PAAPAVPENPAQRPRPKTNRAGRRRRRLWRWHSGMTRVEFSYMFDRFCSYTAEKIIEKIVMPQMTTKQRRQLVRWYCADGTDVLGTCAQFGVSHQYAAHPHKPLRAKSRRAHYTRLPSAPGMLCGIPKPVSVVC